MRFGKLLKYGLIISIMTSIIALVILGAFMTFDNLRTVLAILFFIIVSVSIITGLASYLMGLIEVITSKQKDIAKIQWVAGMVIFGIFVTIIYYFFGRKQLTE